MVQIFIVGSYSGSEPGEVYGNLILRREGRQCMAFSMGNCSINSLHIMEALRASRKVISRSKWKVGVVYVRIEKGNRCLSLANSSRKMVCNVLLL